MSNFVSRQEVIAVPEPEFTKTWRPIGHGRVVQTLDRAVNEMGIGIVNETYSLSQDGARMFGSWNLSIGNGESNYMLGFRNSVNKTMVFGITAGTYVLVCSNMCFSGDFIEFHKHTAGLTDDRLLRLTEDALEGAVIEMEKLDGWQKGLHDYWVPKDDFKSLTYDMMAGGVFSPSNFNAFVGHVEEEIRASNKNPVGRTLDGTRTLHAVHGGATRLMRDWNLLRTADATKRLNSIVDGYIEYKKAA